MSEKIYKVAKFVFAVLLCAFIAESVSHSLENATISSSQNVVSDKATSSPIIKEIASGIPVVEAVQSAPVQAKLVNFNGKFYNYKISIPAIKVNAGVLGMGIDGTNGRMMVPHNYTEVGWYNLGAQPGEKGSSVMGAHVDNGSTINGVFKNLKKLKTGNLIYITDGNGVQFTYRVTARKIYNYKTTTTDEVFLRDDKDRLNLITCYGTWLPKEKTYNQRLVVYSELIDMKFTQH